MALQRRNLSSDGHAPKMWAEGRLQVAALIHGNENGGGPRRRVRCERLAVHGWQLVRHGKWAERQAVRGWWAPQQGHEG